MSPALAQIPPAIPEARTRDDSAVVQQLDLRALINTRPTRAEPRAQSMDSIEC
jgi:hypothetical protein